MKIVNINNLNQLLIGFGNNVNEYNTWFGQSTKKQDIAYRFNAYDGNSTKHKLPNWQYNQSNNPFVKSNDILTLELNLIDNNIKLYKNNRYIATLFDNIQIKNVNYRLAVSLYRIDYCIKLLSMIKYDIDLNATILLHN